jgi:hypothetical protein
MPALALRHGRAFVVAGMRDHVTSAVRRHPVRRGAGVVGFMLTWDGWRTRLLVRARLGTVRVTFPFAGDVRVPPPITRARRRVARTGNSVHGTVESSVTEVRPGGGPEGHDVHRLRLGGGSRVDRLNLTHALVHAVTAGDLSAVLFRSPRPANTPVRDGLW